jgi:hypothetical protein
MGHHKEKNRSHHRIRNQGDFKLSKDASDISNLLHVNAREVQEVLNNTNAKFPRVRSTTPISK